MGTWSIESPKNHPLAGIDGTGKVTFQPHSEMTSYTIKFTGTTAETKCTETTLRGNIVVLPCPSPCTFGVSSTGNKVPNRVTSTTTNVATYTLGTSCGGGSFTFAHVHGSDFLTGLTASSNVITAAVKEDNPSSSVRYGTYKVTFTPNSGAAPPPCTFTVQQDGIAPPTPTVTCPNIGGSTRTTLSPNGHIGNDTQLISLITDIDGTMTASASCNWVFNLSIVKRASKSYDVMGRYQPNTTGSSRKCLIKILCGGDEIGRILIGQVPQ